jgi:hypothetical protein
MRGEGRILHKEHGGKREEDHTKSTKKEKNTKEEGRGVFCPKSKRGTSRWDNGLKPHLPSSFVFFVYFVIFVRNSW